MFTEPVVQGLCMMGLIAFAVSRVICHKAPQTTNDPEKCVPILKFNEIAGWWVWEYHSISPRGLTGSWAWHSNVTRKPPSPPPEWLYYKDEGDNEIKVFTQRATENYRLPPGRAIPAK